MTRKLALLAVLTALLVAGSSASALAGPYDYLLAPAQTCPGQTSQSLSPATQKRVMLCMHNYARAKTGLRPLAANSLLTTSSQRKAGDIMRCQDFSHYACGYDWLFRIKQTGYLSTGCWGAGENIAWGTGTLGSVRSIMRAWVNSTHHRENILNGRFRDAGFGLVTGAFQGYPGASVWVGEFGYRC